MRAEGSGWEPGFQFLTAPGETPPSFADAARLMEGDMGTGLFAALALLVAVVTIQSFKAEQRRLRRRHRDIARRRQAAEAA